MTRKSIVAAMALFVVVGGSLAWSQQPSRPVSRATVPMETPVTDNARRMLEEGRRVFRYETFGDEVYWGDTLKLHRAIAGAKLGGLGPGVSPKMALSVGLKVDVDSVPAPVAAALKAGKVNLDDLASTTVLLTANAV